jgi:hypothetical protein
VNIRASLFEWRGKPSKARPIKTDENDSDEILTQGK